MNWAVLFFFLFYLRATIFYIVFVVLFVGRFLVVFAVCVVAIGSNTHNLMGFNSCALRTTEFMKIFGFGALRLRVLAFSYIISRPNRFGFAFALRCCCCWTRLEFGAPPFHIFPDGQCAIRHRTKSITHKHTHTPWWSGEGEREGESLRRYTRQRLVTRLPKKLNRKERHRKQTKKEAIY